MNGENEMDLKFLAQVYDLEEVNERLGETYWSPIDVALMNDWVLRAAAFKGEFHWHSHEVDELFLVYRGEIVIDTEKGPIHLKEGQGAVIPKGLSHKPKADHRAVVLMIEPKVLGA
jgi:mannose-6-phosphate isomerase-like protein (cupin superfamily)